MYKKQEPEFVEITRLICGRRIKQIELEKTLGCSRQTVKKKLDNPKLFTLDDLGKICRHLNVPADEIRGSIKFNQGAASEDTVNFDRRQCSV